MCVQGSPLPCLNNPAVNPDLPTVARPMVQLWEPEDLGEFLVAVQDT